MKSLLAATGCMMIMGTLFGASSRADDGVWQAASNFAQVNVACTRTYTCGPAKDIMHSADMKVVATDTKLVWGVCSAGQGPVDGCNVCLTNPPKDKCTWSLQKK